MTANRNIATRSVGAMIPRTPSQLTKEFKCTIDTLRSRFGLNDTEVLITLRLITWERLAREQVIAIGTCGHRSVKLQQKDRARIVALIGFGGALGGAKSQQESMMERPPARPADRLNATPAPGNE
jgi:hypothetical protein